MGYNERFAARTVCKSAAFGRAERSLCGCCESIIMYMQNHSLRHLSTVRIISPKDLKISTLPENGVSCLSNAIGHGDILGSVEEGKKADLILVNIEQPHITPTQNLVNTIVDAANGHDVMDSIINGKLVMKNREVLTLDEERIRFEATQHMNEIIKRAY